MAYVNDILRDRQQKPLTNKYVAYRPAYHVVSVCFKHMKGNQVVVLWVLEKQSQTITKEKERKRKETDQHSQRI